MAKNRTITVINSMTFLLLNQSREKFFSKIFSNADKILRNASVDVTQSTVNVHIRKSNKDKETGA